MFSSIADHGTPTTVHWFLVRDFRWNALAAFLLSLGQ
jgi:hypothetical protein